MAKLTAASAFEMPQVCCEDTELLDLRVANGAPRQCKAGLRGIGVCCFAGLGEFVVICGLSFCDIDPSYHFLLYPQVFLFILLSGDIDKRGFVLCVGGCS